MTVGIVDMQVLLPYKKPNDLQEYFHAAHLGEFKDTSSGLSDGVFKLWVMYYLVSLFRTVNTDQLNIPLTQQDDQFDFNRVYKCTDIFHYFNLDIVPSDDSPDNKWFGDPVARKLGFIAFGRWD